MKPDAYQFKAVNGTWLDIHEDTVAQAINDGYEVRSLYAITDPDPQDYFAGLVLAARIRAEKAMVKFPQPNYVLAKLSEEHGEVVKEVVHYAEGRGDWSKLENELIDNLAMMIRLVKEGDQTINFTPPESVRDD
jgi:NTP pyrophosphatase (non-canonical NTP hydrolase)